MTRRRQKRRDQSLTCGSGVADASGFINMDQRISLQGRRGSHTAPDSESLLSSDSCAVCYARRARLWRQANLPMRMQAFCNPRPRLCTGSHQERHIAMPVQCATERSRLSSPTGEHHSPTSLLLHRRCVHISPSSQRSTARNLLRARASAQSDHAEVHARRMSDIRVPNELRHILPHHRHVSAYKHPQGCPRMPYLQEIVALPPVNRAHPATIQLDQPHALLGHRSAVVPGGRSGCLDEAREVQVCIKVGRYSSLASRRGVSVDVGEQRGCLQNLGALFWGLVYECQLRISTG